jgi:hypothetical protein
MVQQVHLFRGDFQGKEIWYGVVVDCETGDFSQLCSGGGDVGKDNLLVMADAIDHGDFLPVWVHSD